MVKMIMLGSLELFLGWLLKTFYGLLTRMESFSIVKWYDLNVLGCLEGLNKKFFSVLPYA